MQDIMKKRIVGIIVLVLIGVLIPVILSQCIHGSDPGDDSMRVYEVTPDGTATPAADNSQAERAEQQAEKPEISSDVPQPDREQNRGEVQPDEAPSPEPATSDDEPKTPPPAGEDDDEVAIPADSESVSSSEQSPESLRRTTDARGWVVQVASFGDEANAQRLARELDLDYNAFYRAGDVDGTTYYRVRIGPFDNEADARKAAAQLRQQGRSTLVKKGG